LRYAVIPELEAKLPKDDGGIEHDGPKADGLTMLHDRVTSGDIARVVAKATGIPVQSLLRGEREKLTHMEDALRERIVGQDEALKAVSNAVRISRAGLSNPNRPVASFMFLGPTGVGKTELCKALAAFLYNDEKRGLITINMSEYHDRYTIARLLGAAPGLIGYDEGGQLTEAVRRRPYAVLLLDELEKAHKDVAMILLQILDEGSLTDSHGRKVDFKNTIICATSNLGSELLSSPASMANNGGVTLAARDAVLEVASHHFPPELINRLDAQIVFNRLSIQNVHDIVSLRLRDVADRIKDRHIVLDVDEESKMWLAEKGYSDVYGARATARVVTQKVVNPLAEKLLLGTIRNGDTVLVRTSPDGKDLVIPDNHLADEGGLVAKPA